MSEQRDVFLCHASEDKKHVLRPVVLALENADISYWYDEAEIIWGDSITEKVNEGLASSRYVVVALSEVFIEKNWPQRELNSALNIEASTGEVRVLPLLIGNAAIRNAILQKYPLLNDKAYLVWEGNARKVISELQKRLSARQGVEDSGAEFGRKAGARRIPMPNVKKKYTQRDRDVFLKTGFQYMKTYFGEALAVLQQGHEGIEVDMTEVHNFKFVVTIYREGEIASKCKIWLGGPTSVGIAYQSGDHGIDQDNSFNDWLEVDDEGGELGFVPSEMGFGTIGLETDAPLSQQQAAEYFWRRFSDDLEH